MFEIQNLPDNRSVPAIFESPIAPRDTYLLLHGLGTGKDEYLQFYERLSRGLVSNGFSTLRIDFSGHGDSKSPPNDFTVSANVSDAASALRWLEQEKGLSKVRIFATSFGASAAVLLAHMFPNRISQLQLLAPVLDFDKLYLNPISPARRDKYRGMVANVLLGGDSKPVTDNVAFGGEMVTELSTIPLWKIFLSLTLPISVMHGRKDGAVPIEISRQAVAERPDTTLEEFDNMEHGFTDFGDEDGQSRATAANLERILNIASL